VLRRDTVDNAGHEHGAQLIGHSLSTVLECLEPHRRPSSIPGAN